jgi:hypothetical protein
MIYFTQHVCIIIYYKKNIVSYVFEDDESIPAVAIFYQND